MFSITDAASSELKRLLSDREPGTHVRASIVGGGCSGLSYKLDFDTKFDDAVDKVLHASEFMLIADAKSNLFLSSCQLDFSGGLNGTGFMFINPNAKRTCGCGSSFSA